MRHRPGRFLFQRRLPGSPRSYTDSTGGKGQPGPQDVLRCVEVSVVRDTASGTGPLTDLQRLWAGAVPARRAHLRRRIPRVNLDDLEAVEGRLVLQHGRELAQPGVVDARGQLGAAHPGDVEGFHAHRLVLTDQPGGELMVEVPAGVGHPGVQPGDPATGLLPVLAALVLAGHVALGTDQRLLPLPQPTRVVDLLPGGEGREAGQAEVNPNRRVHRGQRHLPDLDDE